MAEYFILYFKEATPATLKQWLQQEGQLIQTSEPFFSWNDGGHDREYFCPVPGKFKVHLYKEGSPLSADSEIAILTVEDSEAQKAEEKGLGKILRPEELDKTIAHAEAASIRLPPL